MRHNLRSVAAQRFIAADVIEVPVRIEQQVHRMRIHLFMNRPEQRGGALRVSAVDHHQSVVAQNHANITTVARHHGDAIGKFSGLDRRRRILPESAPAEPQSSRSAERNDDESEIGHKSSLPDFQHPTPFDPKFAGKHQRDRFHISAVLLHQNAGGQ